VETIHAILKEDPLELADGEIRIGGFKGFSSDCDGMRRLQWSRKC
jgi:hypothetical protein